MKGRTFVIIGGVIVAGAIAYAIYKHVSNKYNEYGADTAPEETTPSAPDKYPSCEAQEIDTDIDEVRETAASHIKERHNEAAKVMQDSLNTIFAASGDIIAETENSETLAKTESELEDLLK